MKNRRVARRATLALTVALGLSCVAPVGAASHVKQSLTATGKDPDARGRASLVVRGSNGRLGLGVKRLEGGATFEVIIDGVQIGTLTTGRSGSGRSRFSTRPRGPEQLLGADPRGKLLQVRDEDGDDVLVTEMHDGSDPGAVRCCISDDEETECRLKTPEECAARGGVDMGTGSCMPNPCAPAGPGDTTRCCIPEDDDEGPECEDRTAAECSAAGGVDIGPGECGDDACAPTPPDGDEVRCCIPEHTSEHRLHDGNGDDGDHDDGELECEHVTAATCGALGGTDAGPGSCRPNPCVASPSGAFLDEALARP